MPEARDLQTRPHPPSLEEDFPLRGKSEVIRSLHPPPAPGGRCHAVTEGEPGYRRPSAFPQAEASSTPPPSASRPPPPGGGGRIFGASGGAHDPDHGVPAAASV